MAWAVEGCLVRQGQLPVFSVPSGATEPQRSRPIQVVKRGLLQEFPYTLVDRYAREHLKRRNTQYQNDRRPFS